MKTFIGEDFLIYNESGCKLFHEYAKQMPICDYHNHLVPAEIYNKARFENITEAWLAHDHYKWRAMRNNGVDEFYVTGDADAYAKFEKWAWTVERLPGSPLYHWTHLELQRYFDVYTPLSSATAAEIWQACNEKLQQPDCNAYTLLKHVDVRSLCTTDDPFDTLEFHQAIGADDSLDIKVLPSYRPDKVLHIENNALFVQSVAKMGVRYDMEIATLADLKQAMAKSVAFFAQVGCKVSDHGFIKFYYANQAGADAVFAKAMAGEALTEAEIAIYKGDLLRYLAGEYIKNGMAMQLHLGALRAVNKKMTRQIGVDSGLDSVGEITDPALLGAFLNDLHEADTLPNTVLYCLNSNDNTMMSTMAGNFFDGKTPGKVQFGSAWWFADHVRGINAQLDEMLESGLISTFVGMLTDSRSFTSFTRHEFFRRILCNKLGEIMENGEYPADFEAMGKIVQDICYNNAVNFFGLAD